jgi:hypothetical protein
MIPPKIPPTGALTLKKKSRQKSRQLAGFNL